MFSGVFTKIEFLCTDGIIKRAFTAYFINQPVYSAGRVKNQESRIKIQESRFKNQDDKKVRINL